MFKVSVIIPVYNTEKYLADCLNSVLEQSLKELEVILINDGSTDSSLSIMEKYRDRYPDRIRIFSKENGGQAAARNMAIPLCTGEYIGFVDSDDYIEREMYEKMYHKALKTKADYVECDYVNIKVNDLGKQERIADYGSRVREYTDQKDMFLDPMLAPWNKIYRRELLQNSDVRFPEGLIYEDTAFCLKAISLVNTRAFVEDKLVKHFYRGGSIMNSNQSVRVADIFPVLMDVIRYYKDKGLYENYFSELEYELVKILLCSSMQRIAKIPEKELQKKYCRDTWIMIQRNFPQYKQNQYIRGNGMKKVYMRCVNRKNIYLFCRVLSCCREQI